MTEQTTLAAKVNEILSNRDLRDAEMIAEIKAMLPAPTPATLADMTPKEREACRWMQADVDGLLTRRWLILNPYNENGVVEVVLESGRKEYLTPIRVTPRADLPRMEWPTEAPVPENALAVGSVWEDADALTEAVRESGRDQITVTDCDNNVSVWDGRREDWRTLYPIQKYAPFTIIHAGKGGDQ